jgi:hypothetical protein
VDELFGSLDEQGSGSLLSPRHEAQAGVAPWALDLFLSDQARFA